MLTICTFLIGVVIGGTVATLIVLVLDQEKKENRKKDTCGTDA